uniref:US6 n=1 Tax=Caenorhabditis tropicalis TaxID=1561998 RepID=A0A1I7U2U7_9PELO
MFFCSFRCIGSNVSLNKKGKMSRMDSYSLSQREEQKHILNGLIGTIYDTNDTTRRIHQSVDGIYRMVAALLLIVIALIIIAIFLICFFHCRRQNEERSPLHGNRKSHPIEI